MNIKQNKRKIPTRLLKQIYQQTDQLTNALNLRVSLDGLIEVDLYVYGIGSDNSLLCYEIDNCSVNMAKVPKHLKNLISYIVNDLDDYIENNYSIRKEILKHPEYKQRMKQIKKFKKYLKSLEKDYDVEDYYL